MCKKATRIFQFLTVERAFVQQQMFADYKYLMNLKCYKHREGQKSFKQLNRTFIVVEDAPCTFLFLYMLNETYIFLKQINEKFLIVTKLVF